MLADAEWRDWPYLLGPARLDHPFGARTLTSTKNGLSYPALLDSSRPSLSARSPSRRCRTTKAAGPPQSLVDLIWATFRVLALSIEDYLAAVKDRLEYRKQVLETVAIELGKPVTGLTGYGRWRAEIDRMAEAGQRILDDRDTYHASFPHLNGIPLGLEHMRWALTDIGRLIGKDGKQISEAAGHHRQGEEPATPETHEERQRRLLSEAQEFTRLLSATYDARSEEEARAANKALDELRHQSYIPPVTYLMHPPAT